MRIFRHKCTSSLVHFTLYLADEIVGKVEELEDFDNDDNCVLTDLAILVGCETVSESKSESESDSNSDSESQSESENESVHEAESELQSVSDEDDEEDADEDNGVADDAFIGLMLVRVVLRDS